MVPAHTTVKLQTVFLLVVDIDTDHFAGIEALALTAPAATTTSTREAHVVDIVSSREEHHLHIVLHHSTHATTSIAMLGTDSQIDIGHKTMVHTFLNTEVEHRLLLTILNTRDTGEVALLVVGTDALNDVRGQVLQGRLCIAGHKLLTIDENLLDLLAIDLDGSIVADLSTRETLDKFLDHRSLGRAIRARVIHKGISLERHLRGMSRDSGTLQHDGIGFEGDGACPIVLTILEGDLLRIGFESHIRNLQGITALTRGVDGEAAIGVGHCIGHYLLTREQCRCRLYHGFLSILFYNLS